MDSEKIIRYIYFPFRVIHLNGLYVVQSTLHIPRLKELNMIVTTVCRRRPRGRSVNNPKRCALYIYRRSADGDEVACHSFGGYRTNKLNQPKTKAVPIAWMYYKGAELTYI
ncbi:hypothetical protein V1477_001413 [Vespula maculifrons]|uniref:Uncharacterized protein n=1 Tax=Vespula maculifrons TaxID=7453 RepID=A0ABD2CYY6_VESMC